MISQVPVHKLQAMVPVEDQVALPQGLEPSYTQLHYILEMSISNESQNKTYFLPVGTWRGLMSALLKWAKTSSQGAAS